MPSNRTRVLALRCVIAALLLAHLCLIFHFSAEAAPQSDQTSSSFIETLLRSMDASYASLPPETQAQRIQSLQKAVRTLAHLAEFALLGALTCALLLTFSDRLRLSAFGLPGCALVAAFDELHQLFVPGRTFQWEDIVIDTLGAAIGIAALWLFCLLLRRAQHRKKKGTEV